VSVHGTGFYSVNHAHPPPDRPRRNPRCAVLATRKAHFAFRPREAAKCSRVGHAVRITMPSALQAGQPVGRVGMSPLFQTEGTRPPPCCRPRTPVKWSTASRKPTSEPFPRRSAEMSLLFRSGNPLDTRTITVVSSPPRSPVSIPSHPHNGLLSQSRRRDLSPADRRAR